MQGTPSQNRWLAYPCYCTVTHETSDDTSRLTQKSHNQKQRLDMWSGTRVPIDSTLNKSMTESNFQQQQSSIFEIKRVWSPGRGCTAPSHSFLVPKEWFRNRAVLGFGAWRTPLLWFPVYNFQDRTAAVQPPEVELSVTIIRCRFPPIYIHPVSS